VANDSGVELLDGACRESISFSWFATIILQHTAPMRVKMTSKVTFGGIPAGLKGDVRWPVDRWTDGINFAREISNANFSSGELFWKVTYQDHDGSFARYILQPPKNRKESKTNQHRHVAKPTIVGYHTDYRNWKVEGAFILHRLNF